MPRDSSAPDPQNRPDQNRPAAPNRRKAAAAKATHAAAAKQSGPLRLQRLLASAGYGSRRQCEELIEEGRVDIDGAVVTQMGTTVDPETQKVHVDGVLLRKQKLVYYAVNKPDGVLSTNRDPQGRPRVVDLVPKSERVFPVGRLDRSSTGLMLLTNDGELAQQLTHPKYGVRKVYRVTVAGKVENETMRTMRQGMYISDGFVQVEGAKVLKSRARATEMEIVLREGKNREIRRILARLGHKVQSLTRIAIGPLRLGDLPPGAHRLLGRDEVQKLHLAVQRSKAEALAEAEQAEKDRGGKKRSTKKKAGKAYGSASARSSGNDSKGFGKGTSKGFNKGPRKGAGKGGRRLESDSASEFLPTEAKTRGSVIGGEGDSVESTDRPKTSRRKSVARSNRTTGSGGPKTRGAKKGGASRTRSTKKAGGKPSGKPSNKPSGFGRSKSTGGRSSRGDAPAAQRGKKKPGRKRG
ncbi:pseudouridine synthase [Stieleria varia]|uniref:Pseudouridine synthase n=1 Tax=Stieleria varia TaxID=2528005 RepID=A0A5C5ZY52_9BACT|nr:pseudouridine synthase [Stieleria varia]TWT92096.1 Ribosomal large subunit pseudouridine synthase B [Stieleria varia]